MYVPQQTPAQFLRRLTTVLLLAVTVFIVGCGSEEITPLGVDGAAAAVATQLVFTVQPTTTAANASITPAVRVTAQDAAGNTVTTFNGTIKVAIGNNPSLGVLTGDQSKKASSGVATFSNLSIKKSGVGYTLTAASAGVSSDTSSAFDITSGAATHLRFPGIANTVAGVAISPAVLVLAEDAYGNTATSFTGNVSVVIGTNPAPGGVLSGTTTVTANAGVATFSDLSINRAATGYKLKATSGTFITNSVTFNITPAAATHLIFIPQPPATTKAGEVFNPAIQVTARDAFDNKATGFTGNVTVAIGVNPTGGTLAGATTRAAVAGAAQFSGTVGLSIDNAGQGYTLVATSPGLTAATSNPFNIAQGTSAQLVFTVQPSTTGPGAPFTPSIQVTARTAQGATETGFTGNITMTIGPGTGPVGGILAGTTIKAASNGVATFVDLTLSPAGPGYTLQATATKHTTAKSIVFDINAAPVATQLAFTAQPSNTAAGATISPAVQVTAQNAQGATVTSFTGNITVAIGTNPAGGTLSGTATVAAVSGVASFSTLSIDNAGTGYTLQGTSGSLTAATSLSFNVTATTTSSMVDLGTLPGGTSSSGMAINSGGQIVGEADEEGGQYHAFLWTPTQPGGTIGTMRDLGTLPGATYSSARDINDNGQVVGASDRGDGQTHAFLWENDVMTDLGTLPGGTSSVALGINANRQVVGYSTGADGLPHAFRWENDVMTDLGTLPGGTDSEAEGINSQGDVVGRSETATGENHATVWLTNGQQLDLGTPGGSYSQAFDISDAGQVIGSGGRTGNVGSAAVSWQNMTMTELVGLGGANTANHASDISDNAAGTVLVAGTSQTPGAALNHAVLWRNRAITDLGTLGGEQSNAEGVNNRGQVVGGSLTTGNVAFRAVLWTGF